MTSRAAAELAELMPEVEAPDWADALCAQIGPDLFFPEQGCTADATAAKWICGRCPLTTQCREWAIATRQEHGVWGGLSGRQLVLERRRRQREVAHA